MKLDLNCDLGEGEPPARTRALMRWITSANVACGGHAGDLETLERCVRLCQAFDVHLGAHPGSWNRSDKGRASIQLNSPDLELLLLQQVGALQRIASQKRVPLHHIKLHGALYHATEADLNLGNSYLRAVKRWWPNAILYVRAGGELARRARRCGVRIWEEAFADRGYTASGHLIPRDQRGALLHDPRQVCARIERLLRDGKLAAADGTILSIKAQTLCVHSDTPKAAVLVRAISRLLKQAKTDFL